MKITGIRDFRERTSKDPQARSSREPNNADFSMPKTPVKIGIAVVSGLVLAGACGGHEPRVNLQGTASPGAAVSPSSTPSAQQAAMAAYTGFLDAAKRAMLAPPGQARSILGDYVTGAYLDWEVRQVMEHHDAHQVPWGNAVVHVTGVDLRPRAAKVHDCQDASNAGLADARTHELIPSTRGTANRNLIADMTLGGDGRWRVAGLKERQGACQVP